MSITAEKIEEALAYLESEYSIKECCGHPVGGNGPEDEPACCAQPDLYLRSDKVKETILSLLQQGEPEGWKLVPVEPTRPMLDAALHSSRSWTEPYTAPRESGVAIDSDIDEELAETINEAGRQGYANDYKAMLSASPLPPATEQGWRPIETAPKDGTKIITFAPDGGIEVSFYYADTLENGTAYETWRDDGCEPTHWMPLPPAPGAETSVTTGATLEAEEREMRRLAERLGYEIENPAASSSRQAVLEKALREISALRSTCNVFGARPGSYDIGYNNAIFAAAKIAEAAIYLATPPAEGETK